MIHEPVDESEPRPERTADGNEQLYDHSQAMGLSRVPGDWMGIS